MASGLVVSLFSVWLFDLIGDFLHDLSENVHQIMIKTIESNCVLLFGYRSFCIKIDFCEMLDVYTTERFKKRETLFYCERCTSILTFANG